MQLCRLARSYELRRVPFVKTCSGAVSWWLQTQDMPFAVLFCVVSNISNLC